MLSSFPVGSEYATGVAISGSTAFVADFNAGLQIIDISNLTSPRLLSSFPAGLGGNARGVAISGNTTFIADETAGLQIIDVSNLTSPRLLSSFPAGLGGDAYGVAISGSTAFVADVGVGLQILDISQWQLTASPGVADVGNYILQLTATDALGGSVTTQPFTIRVKARPKYMA